MTCYAIEMRFLIVLLLAACGPSPEFAEEPATPVPRAPAPARTPTPATQPSAVVVAPTEPSASSAPSAPSGPTEEPLPAPESLVGADGRCKDDAAEPDDEPSPNQLTRWTGKIPPPVRVACPGNVDFIQGVGDFTMNAFVRWNDAHGELDVTLVDGNGKPYKMKVEPYNQGESMSIERGLWRVVGGNHHHFIRVKNAGKRPIAYEVHIEGVWGE